MKKILSSVMVVAAVALSSCNQWIDYNLNVDPNNPTDATPNLVLAPIQASQGWLQGGALGRLSCLMNQQFEGIDRQQQGLYNYLLTLTDGDDAWQTGYNNVLTNVNILLNKTSRAQNLVYYRGVAQVMRAVAIGTITDTWGDVPFSEASNPDNPNFTPKYDSQQEIYTRIQQILDSAIVNLNATSGIAVSGDLIYGGAADQRAAWRKLAWTLKARYAIHLTKRQGNAAATAALASVARGMTSNDDNALVVYGAAETTANPLYQFQQARTGDLTFGSTMKRLMEGLKDPRLGPFGTDRSAYPGFGPYYHSQASPVAICLYAEHKFIEAEANQRLGNNAAAKAAYTAGITASLQQIGVSAADITTYLAQPSVTPSGDVTLRQIMEQKYIALFAQPESFTDWRRTGFPVLAPVRGTRIPRRLFTPISELQFNRVNIPNGSTDGPWLFTNVWWDAN